MTAPTSPAALDERPRIVAQAGAIRVRDLRKRYGAVEAVRGITLEVRAGEIFGLIGPDGAGKTSTFQILAGVMEATSGTAEVFGRPAREARTQTGYLTQTFSLYPDLSVDENLRYIGALRLVTAQEITVRGRRYLRMFGMDQFASRMAGQLSGGMKQKLALACALVPQPQVLLLDEPASGVDPQGRIDLKHIIRRMAEERKTVLISSHILSEMNEFCTSVVIMEKGQIVIGGRIDEVNQRVLGDSFLTVEVLGEVELFQWVVGSDDRAGAIEHKGNGTYEFRFRGDAQAASELLSNLVQHGVRISGFGRKRDNLEDLFLKVGSKELS